MSVQDLTDTRVRPATRKLSTLFSAAASACLLLAGLSQARATTATVTADFNYRSASGFAIPADLFGVGVGGAFHADTLPLMTAGGLTYTRFHALIENTYKTDTPNWTSLDAEMTSLQNAGMHVILEMDYTPGSLQPSTNPCPSGTAIIHAPPTSVATLAAMATAYVRHLDLKFPGLVLDYEVWNEPDGGGLCATGNTQAAKLASYLKIFAAVAPAIHNAAAKDGVTVRTGGPTLGAPITNATDWINGLLTNKTTAPYVDFVSYHYYVAGAKNVDAGLSWNGNASTGAPSLYAMTQTTGAAGFGNVFKSVSALVRKGSQPNASTTPIYLDEYNSDYSFVNDCCRNNQTYAPLWNSMVYVDLLNTVYSGATQVPSKILYYAISNPPFCIAGTYDTNMDCAFPSSGTPTAYPQYYAMKLFSSRTYLGLQDGGHMAASVSSSDTHLLATAFWTTGGDSIVIVNPTGTSYTNVTVTANSASVPSAHGTVDLVNGSNREITSGSVSVQATSTGYTAAVNVPAYSTVAVTISK